MEGVWPGTGGAVVMGLTVAGTHCTGTAAVFPYGGQPQAVDPAAISPPTLA